MYYYLFIFQENNAFFVTTNMIITPNQTQGTCPEDPKFKGVNCTTSNICIKGKAVYTGHGEINVIAPKACRTLVSLQHALVIHNKLDRQNFLVCGEIYGVFVTCDR